MMAFEFATAARIVFGEGKLSKPRPPRPQWAAARCW